MIRLQWIKKFFQNELDTRLCVVTWDSYFYLTNLFKVVNASHNKIITAVREPISQNISLLFQIGDEDEWLVDQPEFWKNDYSKLLYKIGRMDSGEGEECIYE